MTSIEEANKEAEQLLAQELAELNKEVPDREQLFYDLAKDRYGVVTSEGGRYLVALNEFSVFFPATVNNPYYKGEEVELH